MSIMDESFGGYESQPSKSTNHPQKGRFMGPAGGPPCPTCGTRNTSVIDSRPTDKGQRRRRKCNELDSCARWSTIELNGTEDDYKTPEISVADKNRVLRILEVADALRASLKIPK